MVANMSDAGAMLDVATRHWNPQVLHLIFCDGRVCPDMLLVETDKRIGVALDRASVAALLVPLKALIFLVRCGGAALTDRAAPCGIKFASQPRKRDALPTLKNAIILNKCGKLGSRLADRARKPQTLS